MSAYLKCLIKWKAFDMIQVLQLPIGHTYEHIDQDLSWTSQKEELSHAVTLSELDD